MRVLSDLKEEDSPVCDCRYACDCREALFSKARETQRRVVEILAYSDDHMRLHFGELTAQEIRTVRAVLNSTVGKPTAMNSCP